MWMIAPWTNALDIYTVRDDFSKVMGAHTIRFGGFLGWNGKHEMNGANSQQYPTFGTCGLGYQHADRQSTGKRAGPGRKMGLLGTLGEPRQPDPVA